MNGLTGAFRAQADVTNKDSALAKVHKTIDDVNRMSGVLAPRVENIARDVEKTAAKLREYVEYDVASLLISLRQTGTNILKVSRDFSELSGQAASLMSTNRDNLDEMIDNMAIVSADLKATAKEIRRNPWRLIYKPAKEEVDTQNIFDAARSFANGAEQLDQALTKLKSVDPEKVDPELLKRIQEHLDKTFERFSRAEQALWKAMSRTRKIAPADTDK